MMRIVVPVVLALLSVTGCSKNPALEPTATDGTTTHTLAPPTTPSPITDTAPTAPAIVFSGEGVGPYVFGARLSDMQVAGLLNELRQAPEVCGDSAYALGAGVYTGIHLEFSHGVLVNIGNRSTTIPTAAGARVGNTLAELQSIYGASGKKLIKEGTSEVAFLATSTLNRGIIFYFDRNGKVHTMAAGVPEELENSFQYELDC